MIAKVSIAYSGMPKSAPQLPKNSSDYFISTRNICRIDDLLEIGLGAMALKMNIGPTLYGAMAGTALIDTKSYGRFVRYDNEDHLRARRFRSICFSLLLGTAMSLEKTPVLSMIAGYCAVDALGRQVIPKKATYS